MAVTEPEREKMERVDKPDSKLPAMPGVDESASLQPSWSEAPFWEGAEVAGEESQITEALSRLEVEVEERYGDERTEFKQEIATIRRALSGESELWDGVSREAHYLLRLYAEADEVIGDLARYGDAEINGNNVSLASLAIEDSPYYSSGSVEHNYEGFEALKRRIFQRLVETGVIK